MTINTPQPGRELDALVAEKVMGLSVRQVKEYAEHIQGRDVAYMGEWVYNSDDPMSFAIEVPYYSTDIAAAWRVVEMFSGYEVSANPVSCTLPHHCALYRFDVAAHTDGLTAPHAICLAALKAVGALD